MLKGEGRFSWRCLYSRSTALETAFLLALSSRSSLVMKSSTAEHSLKSTFLKNDSEIMEGAHS